MLGKNNSRLRAERQGCKQVHYAIKKLTVGVASVAVAASVFLSGGSVTVSAQSVTETLATGTSVASNEERSEATIEQATESLAKESEVTSASLSAESAAEQSESDNDLAKEPIVSSTESLEAPNHPSTASVETTNQQPEQPTMDTSVEKSTASQQENEEAVAIKPTAKVSNALPRPTNEGQMMPVGSTFRNTEANTSPGGAEASTRLSLEEYRAMDVANLAKQIVWIDFTDRSAVSNYDVTAKDEMLLKVGTTFRKEVAPDYVITAEVVNLRPYHASDVFRDKVRGTDKESLYQPQAKNHQVGRPNIDKRFLLRAQDPKFSHLRLAGVSTENRLTSITFGNAIAGVEMRLSATYRGVPVATDVVMVDGEEAKPNEASIFTTNGAPWQLLAELAQPASTGRYRTLRANEINPALSNPELSQVYVDQKEDGGLGTQIFGPVVTSLTMGSVPIITSRDASLIGAYFASGGAQSLQIGFLIKDRGDAPASYGVAEHLANTLTYSNEPINQPYLGTAAPDFDFIKEKNNETLSDWVGDDQHNGADEGEAQLVGGQYPAHTVTNNTYTITVLANSNGAAQAHVSGWVDFNNNKVFDDNERAAGIIQGSGSVSLTFNNLPILLDTTATHLGARVRIATAEGDVLRPTGVAMSGEVEDFLIPVVHPPRGEKTQVTGIQGRPVSDRVTFTALGTVGGRGETPNTMDANRAAQIVAQDGRLVTELTVSGEGRYEVAPDGTVTFTPEPQFVGTANGVVVRRWDQNNNSTEWTHPTADANNNNQVNTQRSMDGVFVPTMNRVTPMGSAGTSEEVQGQTQHHIPQFTPGHASVPMAPATTQFVVNGSPISETAIEAKKGNQVVGSFALNPETGAVTFTPNKSFYGQVDPITLQQADQNGTVATATYQPTVLKVTPTGQPAVSTGVQGKEQAQTVQFTPGDNRVSIAASAQTPAAFVVGGQAVSETDIAATKDGKEVGRYRLDPHTGTVTFAPNAQFVGVPDAVSVTVTDANGTPAIATYTPEVTAVRPTSQNVTSQENQGQVQKKTPVFTPGHAEVPIVISTTQPAKFVSATGEALPNTIPALYQGQQVGTYTLDPQTGEVTFTPFGSFVGTPDAAIVQVQDANGTPITATYTPTVLPVQPSGINAASQGLQGHEQTGTPSFSTNDLRVPIAASAQTPARFVVNGVVQDAESTPALQGDQVVGTFFLDKETGAVRFVPNKTFYGQVDPVTIQVLDKNGTPATATYQPTVIKITPTATSARSEGNQGQPQTGRVTFEAGDRSIPMQPTTRLVTSQGTVTDDLSVPAYYEGKQVGTYSIDSGSGTVTFTPNKEFIGTPDPAIVEAQDENGTPVRGQYTPSVRKVTPTGQSVTSTGIQGLSQQGTPTFQPGDAAVPIEPSENNPAKFVVNNQEINDTTIPAYLNNEIVGQYELDPATGTITFTPNKPFVGMPDPVAVQVRDANGTPAQAQYIPRVTEVVPTATPATSEGVQGRPQTRTPQFTAGDNRVPIAPSATTPARFVVNGVASDDTTINATKDGAVVGTYTIDPQTGTVRFTPNPSFVGSADPVSIQVVDANGTPATATYTPTVTAITPTGEDWRTTGVQGVAQSGTPQFREGDPTAPVTITADQPARFVVNGVPTADTEIPAMSNGAQVGTYTIDPLTGTVTFTPNKEFVGTPDSVTVQVQDKNGTPVTATYTATVEAVTPTAQDVRETGKQGQVQTATPTFTAGHTAIPIAPSATTPARFVVNGVASDDTTINATKDGAVVGTYTIDPQTGTVRFTPNPSFVGSADPVSIQVVDANGTPATATYTPTVTAITPTGEDWRTTGVQGVAQSGTPQFREGDPTAPVTITADQPARFVVNGVPTADTEIPAMSNGAQVGTYTIDPLTGTVTFTPNKEFVGTPDSVTVQVQDKNGTPVTATYTATVEAVVPTAKQGQSAGVRGAVQIGRVTFAPGDERVALVPESMTLLTAEGVPMKQISVAGVGTYVVTKEGTIEFTPDINFVGEAPAIRVQIADVNGETVETEYRAIVVAVADNIVVQNTPISREDIISKLTLPPGSEIVSMEELPASDTPGYKGVTLVVVRIPGENGAPDTFVELRVPTLVTPIEEGNKMPIVPIQSVHQSATLPNTGTLSQWVPGALAAACFFSGFLCLYRTKRTKEMM